MKQNFESVNKMCNNSIFVLTQTTQSNSSNVSGAALSVQESACRSILSYNRLNITKDFIIAFYLSEEQLIWNWNINT